MILLYCKQLSPRISYIFEEIFGRRLGSGYRVVSSVDEFNTHAGPRLNYSHTHIDGSLHVVPSGLLSEEVVKEQQVSVNDHPEWNKVFFETPGTIPFDLFSAAFFLITRYEEYLPHEQDARGRYLAAYSTAVRNGFIRLPLVDLWCVQLRAELEKRFSGFHFPVQKAYAGIVADIDFVYRYRGMGLWRQSLKLARASAELRWKDVVTQLRVMGGSVPDPYDTYSYVQQAAHGMDVHWFMLMSSRGGDDKNLDPRSPELAEVARKVRPGLHPSLYSHVKPESVIEEKQLLESHLGEPVTSSRQHFLKFRLPDTYAQLARAGITDDFSMQYESVCGFRPSTARPFLFFDLQANRCSTLLVHPVAGMDVTWKDYMKCSPDEACAIITELWANVRKVNGQLLTAWHNSTFCEDHGWKGWRSVFDKLHTLV